MSDPDRPTASMRLERLLHILPAACREGGVSFRELQDELGVTERTIMADLKQLLERSYQFQAGSPGDIQMLLSEDRVEVWTSGEFRRPVRLSAREALALGLGLRMAALSPAVDEPSRREDVRRRIEAHLATTPVDELLDRFEAADLGPDPEGLRETLSLAARDRTPCRIRYLKLGDAGSEAREVHPYLVVHAEGRWYLIGHCETAEAVRIFRIDRILDTEPEAGSFEVPADFEPADYLDRGRAFRAEHETEAAVRYSSSVARWLEELGEGERGADGDRLVRHRVADADWLVRHVLGYGGEAEVVEPPDLRPSVEEAARRVADRHA